MDEVIKRKKCLLTWSEKQFYDVLLCALPGYRIMCKVRVLDLVDIGDEGIKGEFMNKHIDFVVCDDMLKVVAAIELNGGSHKEKARYLRDMRAEELFHEAGLPLVWFKVLNEYDMERVRAKVTSAVMGVGAYR
jgi:hypothetical protein